MLLYIGIGIDRDIDIDIDGLKLGMLIFINSSLLIIWDFAVRLAFYASPASASLLGFLLSIF